MDEIERLVVALGVSELDADTSAAFLCGNADDPVIIIPQLPILQGAVRTIKETSAGCVGAIPGSLLKSIGACAYSTLQNASDFNMVVAAARLLLSICDLPGAAAYGISNTNILTALTTSIIKIVVFEISMSPQSVVARVRVKLNHSSAVESHDRDVASLRRSKRSTAVLQEKVDTPREEQEGSILECEEILEESSDEEYSDLKCGRFMKSSAGQNAKPPGSLSVHRVTPSSLDELVNDLSSHLDLFHRQSEAHLLECCADCLGGLIFLLSVRPEFKQSLQVASRALFDLAVVSMRAMVYVFKSLMPALTLCGRDIRLPDSTMSKQRILCHLAATEVMVSLTSHFERLDSHRNPAAANSTNADGGFYSLEMPSSAAASCNATDRRDLGEKDLNHPSQTSTNASMPTPLPFHHSCIVGILQRMVSTVPDRAQSRSTLLTSITGILDALGTGVGKGHGCSSAVDRFVLFLDRLSHSSKMSYRAFSLDLAVMIMGLGWFWETPRERCTLLALIIGRCGDISSIVRVRAMGALSDLMKSLNPLSDSLKCDLLYRSLIGDPLDDGVEMNLISVLRGRTTDEKPIVRAKALEVLGICFCTTWTSTLHKEELHFPLTDDSLGVFVAGCKDSSTAVRKQSVSSLARLLRSNFVDCRLQQTWVASVLPLISDPELTVQVKVAASAHELLVQSVIRSAPTINKTTAQTITGDVSIAQEACWSLLDKIAGAGNDHTKLLSAAIKVMIQQGLLKDDTTFASRKETATGLNSSGISSLFSALRIACRAEFENMDKNSRTNDQVNVVSRGAWVLLDAAIGQVTAQPSDKPSLTSSGTSLAKFVVKSLLVRISEYDSANSADCIDTEETVRMLRVLDKVAHFTAEEDGRQVSRLLQQILQRFEFGSEFVSVAVATNFSLTKVLSASTPYEYAASVIEWSEKLLGNIQSLLFSFAWKVRHECAKMLNSGSHSECWSTSETLLNLPEPRTVVSALFLLGELAMLGFTAEEDEEDVETTASSRFTLLAKPKTTFRLAIPNKLITLVQLLLNSNLPTQSGVCVQTIQCPDIVRANAFVTLGKICLRDRTYARDHINVFLREITPGTSKSLTVRSNCLLILGDLCVRYTSLVEHHIGTMAGCLQDTDVTIRRHTMILLTQLLVQDYLKWRGLLLFRYLASAADPDPETADLCKALIKGTVLGKYPDFLAQHFATAVIVFNNCVHHPSYVSKAACGSDGSSALVTVDGVNLAGREASKRATRLSLYDFMMESFTEEQRIQVTTKLVQEVLSFALDQPATTLNLSSFQDVLEDSFLILQSPLLTIGPSCTVQVGEENSEFALATDEDLESGKAASLTLAKSKVLKTISKQHLLSHTIPIVCSLKHVLEKNRSPLQGALMDYLVALVKANRSEVEDMFKADPSLRLEVEYDLKQYEILSQDRHSSRLEFGTAAELGRLPCADSSNLASITHSTEYRRRNWSVVVGDEESRLAEFSENSVPLKATNINSMRQQGLTPSKKKGGVYIQNKKV